MAMQRASLSITVIEQLQWRHTQSIGNLTSLVQIYLAANNLKGTIPHEIGDLSKVQILSLPGVNVHGVIPPTTFNMSSLIRISLASNQLSGSLPVNIGLGVPNLKQLLVSGNNLTGAIPNFISNASNIITTDMAANYFSGFIRSRLCALPNLERLNLSDNQLNVDTSAPEVNFFSCLANLRNLGTLLLAKNPLNALLPISFGNLSTSLQYIDLSESNVRGDIPYDIGNMSSLSALF
ncbi:probable LRR receptor-like serine/threonine-protein kinase At3g47570 [Argentina anserina]|uniref:probable LRR receptor-like serine/threonine-protein kinase At3g47570 n=1 Tax=Argentina anserina TaxID=57926 RepID=UPI0021764995|nr:probable LRR receptor-like serine/threonine-protein kinase At3g47570 [Potentilla anserina]